jgi:hypothetical protein
MSRYAYLLCVPDREYVWLGKLITRADGSATVDAVPAEEVEGRVRDFLATHLEHELRTLAEDTPSYPLLNESREAGSGTGAVR